MEVGKHPTITHLLKGAFHERPPLPQYTSTWDVNVVLQYLKGLGPSADLILKQLTYKLVMLLALTRPSRSADLSSLSLARRRFSPEVVTFLLRLWLSSLVRVSPWLSFSFLLSLMMRVCVQCISCDSTSRRQLPLGQEISRNCFWLLLNLISQSPPARLLGGSSASWEMLVLMSACLQLIQFEELRLQRPLWQG